jgi:hypothetical protein
MGTPLSAVAVAVRIGTLIAFGTTTFAGAIGVIYFRGQLHSLCADIVAMNKIHSEIAREVNSDEMKALCTGNYDEILSLKNHICDALERYDQCLTMLLAEYKHQK